MTLEQKWFGKKPSGDHFRIFGSLCYEHVPDKKRKKWNNKVEPMLLVGYHSTSGYRV